MDATQFDAPAASRWFAFDHARLQELALASRDDYVRGDPFPHAVIDGLLPDGVLEGVVGEFPDPTGEWRHFDDVHQRKFGAGLAEADLGPVTRNVLAELNSAVFVDFLRTLTGIEEPLIPDPYYRGGGLHEIVPGGHLDVHADFNRHPDFGLDRRVNVLVYLNHDWRPEWGGQLELWDAEMTRAVRLVEPVFNRAVVFTITDTAFHGHPRPLQCPSDRRRRSLALYYYSNGRPETERAERHATLWQRPRADPAGR